MPGLGGPAQMLRFACGQGNKGLSSQLYLPLLLPYSPVTGKNWRFFRIRCHNTLNLSSDPLSYNLAALNGSVSTSLAYVKAPQSRVIRSSSLFSLLVNYQFFRVCMCSYVHFHLRNWVRMNLRGLLKDHSTLLADQRESQKGKRQLKTRILSVSSSWQAGSWQNENTVPQNVQLHLGVHLTWE